MKLERFPLGDPDLGIFPGSRKYPFYLKKDFVYLWPGYGHWKPMAVCVPKDYETDLLSIPKVLWPILSPFGAGCWASLPHDILYSSEFSLPDQSRDDARAMADRILHDAAVDSGASKMRTGILYSGVRVGGGATWKDHDPAEVSDDLQMLAEATDRWEKRWLVAE